ncbi:MAG: hypothetical protein MJE68_00650, partial [Proteobacteria bacterium]|nr:hypothetical protein [Pseudomonadota bacterium]
TVPVSSWNLYIISRRASLVKDDITEKMHEGAINNKLFQMSLPPPQKEFDDGIIIIIMLPGQ